MLAQNNDSRLNNLSPGFNLRNLSVLAYTAGFTLWAYNGLGDELINILATDYFRDAQNLAHELDVVIISCKERGVITAYFKNTPDGRVILQPVNNLLA